MTAAQFPACYLASLPVSWNAYWEGVGSGSLLRMQVCCKSGGILLPGWGRGNTQGWGQGHYSGCRCVVNPGGCYCPGGGGGNTLMWACTQG